MYIFIAADHRGYAVKQAIVAYLHRRNISCEDLGGDTYDANDDFPVFTAKAAHAVLGRKDSFAILVCGSGQGMVMAANRIRGIRAGLGWSIAAARSVRNDEDSNVLAIPAELFEQNEQHVYAIIDTFLDTPFAQAARYKRRNIQLDQL